MRSTFLGTPGQKRFCPLWYAFKDESRTDGGSVSAQEHVGLRLFALPVFIGFSHYQKPFFVFSSFISFFSVINSSALKCASIFSKMPVYWVCKALPIAL